MLSKLKLAIRNFFVPPRGSPRWLFVLPYAVLGILTISLLVGGAYAWDYTNSPGFCGTSCHTMPPEYTAYQASPHARIACVECHIGREFIGNQIFRKAGDVRHIVAMTFQTYEYPIQVKNMRPARESCERCHTPEKFSDDSLRVIKHFQDDQANTELSTYLVLKTGGGAKRENLGRGIHWHIVNQVYYYPTDSAEQTIPYVKVVNDDGSTVDYVDVQAGFDRSTMDPSKLKQMDCITCHNRITHHIYTPEESVDQALALGTISKDIPEIKLKAVEALRGKYTSQSDALAAIDNLDSYYQTHHSGFYGAHPEDLANAISTIKQIYTDSVFLDQKVDWNTHPSNIGHMDSPGCFRCHDGKHLDSNQQAIRMECNLCHSIPVVAGPEDFVSKIEISQGPEPTSHRNPNWISLHNKAIDTSCTACHDTKDAGGTSNTSFCSNSACHGNVFTYAGFDAPNLRAILQAQIPTPAPTPVAAPVEPNATPVYDVHVGPLFQSKCSACHNITTLAGGLDLTTYASVMKGGKDGPVVVPGDPASSLLIKIQSDKHFMNLTPDELSLVEAWISSGAPEK